MEVIIKTCKTCNNPKVETEFYTYIYKDKICYGPICLECKKCKMRLYHKKWRKDLKDSKPDKYRERLDNFNTTRRKLYTTDESFSEKYKQYSKGYREQHKNDPNFILKNKQYQKKHYNFSKYHTNPEFRESILKNNKQWAKNNPEVKKAIAQTRYAKLSGSTGNYTSNDLIKLKIYQENRCVYCSVTLTNFHLDHIVPLSKGGSNWNYNIVYSCPDCNLHKTNKLLYKEWIPIQQLISIQDWKLPIIPIPHSINYNYTLPIIEINNIGIVIIPLFWYSERYNTNKNLLLELKLNLTTKYKSTLYLFDDEIISPTFLNILQHKLGTSTKIGARKLSCKILDNHLGRNFMHTYHLQGDRSNASLFIGLVDGMNHIYGTASFIAIDEQRWELARLAFNGHIAGGFSKIISYFKMKFPDSKLISYCDQRIGNGNSYKLIGFEPNGETKLPYWYIRNGKRENRLKYSYSNMITKVDYFDTNLTEHENTKINGIHRIYGLPHNRFILK